MSEQTSPTVECPVCGETFDTSRAEGWCTNEDCGEWQYRDTNEESDTTQSAETGDTPHPDEPSEDTPSGETSESATGGSDSGRDETDSVSPDETETVSGTRSEREEGTEDGHRDENGDSDGGNVDAADVVQSEATEVAGARTGTTECTECGEQIAPGDSFCPNCGQELTSDESDVLSACPECGRVVEPTDNYCVSCGENLVQHRTDETETRAEPETLVIATRGKELTVTDGDTVGRELRRIIMETGGDEDQAVRIHREHARFIRKNGQFYMIDLGTNPTRLNGRPLEKGDQVPVEPGDEMELSGVIGLVLREP